jgi:hypothetical protein
LTAGFAVPTDGALDPRERRVRDAVDVDPLGAARHDLDLGLGLRGAAERHREERLDEQVVAVVHGVSQ